MKKRLSEFTEKECIHIDNENDWKRIVSRDNPCYHDWHTYKKNTCFRPFVDRFSDLEWSKNNNFTIYQPSDVIIEDEFINGEEYEFSDDCKKWVEELFYIGKTRKGRYLSENENGTISNWKYIRKPQTEKTKAIETIKELANKHNIKLSEL